MVNKYVKYAKTKDISTVQIQSFCGKLYLLLHIPRRLRVALAEFRAGNNDRKGQICKGSCG